MRIIAKVNRKAERNRNLFLQIGFCISLLFTLVAFEWNTEIYVPDEFGALLIEDDIYMEEIVPILIKKHAPLPPPPAPKKSQSFNKVIEPVPVDPNPSVIEPEPEPVLVAVAPKPEPVYSEPEPVLLISEILPKYPGGESAMVRYFQKNIKYPAKAKREGLTGLVYIELTIDRHGNVVNVHVIKGIGGGCDEEAYRVVQNMPKWAPGQQAGVPVNVKLTVPIRFMLL